MKIKFLLFTVLLSLNCFSQFSKTHYIPPLSNTQAYETRDQYLYISCPSLTDINYRIISIGGGVTSGTVRRDNPQTIHIGFGDDTQLLANGTNVSTVLNNKGYIIEADDLIYVTVRLTAASNNHAGGLVSKGLAALGTQFRIGAFVNTGVSTDARHYTFASILATENNTVVSFSDIKPGVILTNDPSSGNTPPNVTLNSGESYIIAVEGPNPANADGLIGALISSTKPIAVNCGSFGGSNGNLSNNSDIGFDQIVSAERTGKEYIFIRGDGENIIERPLIVADVDNTLVYLNGATAPTPPFATLMAGDYIAIDGSEFSQDGNLYVRTTEKVFAYQGIGGTSQANQNMHFVPPLSCETPKIINNIPFINQVGTNAAFIGTVCIVAKTGASLNFTINGNDYTLATLSSIGVNVNGPSSVLGNPDYQTYTFQGLTGNISVFSSKSVYLSYYGSSGAATYGGFYSGFTFKPEVSFSKIDITTQNCIPNVKLSVNSLTAFDTFEWFFNGNPIVGANTNEFTPALPGYYKVRASISGCGSPIESDEIPVSDCPTNMDNDLANDNIDIDNNNNGLTNCLESSGDQNINTALSNGTIPLNTVTYTGTVTNSLPQAAIPFMGNIDGSFVTEIPPGKEYYVAYNLNFSQPTNISLEYPSTANATDLLNTNAEYIVNSDTNRTITVLNSTNQLLIDTNYDGIYESGVTQFSSFEIRFRLNDNVPLTAGTGTFKFQSFQTTHFKITHKNLLDNAGNKSTFRIIATCVPKDSDGDGIPNQLDSDNDNDGILDAIEIQSNNPIALSNTDANLDGFDDAFGTGLTPIDSDVDGIVDYLDLDSDNDGILDLNESTVDTDADGILNFRELDSDGDLCNDVIEAGFLDPNSDGILGNNPVTVNANGQVTSGVGYTSPNANYTVAAPIAITTQPQSVPTCELQNTTITLADNGGNTYQWQLSTDGVTWNNLTNNAMYSGVTTSILNITGVTNAMSTYKYRVQLNKVGNSCGLISAETTLTIYQLPVVNNITLVQCDDNLDGISAINLTVNNNTISANVANETFTYYTSLAGAQTGNPTQLIANPVAFVNSASLFSVMVWARVVNANGCFSVAQINAQVSATQIPASYNPKFNVCDDFVDIANDDKDGISNFDVSSVTTDLLTNVLSTAVSYSIKYYRNTADRDSQTNPISDISDFRNNIRDNQTIWARVDSAVSNACFGYAKIDLTVNALPKINITATAPFCTNVPGFSLILDAGITDATPTNNYTYKWFKDNVEIIGETNYTLTITQVATYSVIVTNTYNCSRTRTITLFISGFATILPATIVDLTDDNTVTINVSGDGDYTYSLDSEFGPFQESNVFYDVSAGIHTAYIKDMNGCGTVFDEINILGTPKFFTPNGDGYHDTWNLQGVSGTFNSTAKILIFDRFGKLLKEITPLGQGWNGTYNGVNLPADDYWYTIQLKNGRTAKGNFALKR